MRTELEALIDRQLAEMHRGGTYKSERILSTLQSAHVEVGQARSLLNLCANNYLGLSSHPDVIAAAHAALDRWGYGLSSVRFICGTQQLHKELEARLSQYLGTEDTILYSSCFDANGGVFETLLAAEDAVISDELNHASIIDGIRLCKAQRYRYRNSDMADLEAKLQEAIAAKARVKLIVTDGVFSMDGYVANLPAICELADRYDALVMVDDSHGVGVCGQTGRGTHELHGVMGRVDILTGTLGKALGGASGGYVSAHGPIVELLRQRSRPYLFSNSVAPAIVGASLHVLDMVTRSTELRDKLAANTEFFRGEMTRRGFQILPGTHPIVPIMFGDANVAKRFAEQMLERGVYVVAFSYPVVPLGKARIRTQVSAGHSREDLEFAVRVFDEVRQQG